MEEYIPQFEESAETQIELVERTNNLVKIDEFEDKIKQLKKITEEYDKLKKQLKEEMLKIAKENNLEQVKWTTPKNIKVTLSVGKEAEYHIETRKEFDSGLLLEKYPEIYEECVVEKEHKVFTQNASSDRLVITLPKDKNNE